MQRYIADLTNRTRTLSILAGIVIGAILCAWCAFGWVPVEAFFTAGMAPRLLRTDTSNMSPQYREVYWVDVARRYQQKISQPQAALTEAQNLLGLTTGDVTKDDALNITAQTLQVVQKENAVDGSAGLFTDNDALALTLLQSALQAAPPISVGTLLLNRIVNNPALWVGGLLSCLAIPLILIGLSMLLRSSAPEPAVAAPAAAVVPEPHDVAAASLAGDIIDSEPMPVPDSVTTGSSQPTAAPVVVAAAAAAAGKASSASSDTYEAKYAHGDESFDEDFSITAPSGELEGECGVSIADRLGLDSPAKVDALAVWVFDKADFKSITKVVCSDYAFQNQAIHDKLAKKGEVLRARSGDVFEIETSRMRVTVRADDVTLNADDPANSYFVSAHLTFNVQRKPSTATVST